MNTKSHLLFSSDIKIGVLGGGQLGKMLCQAANPWNWHISVLEKSPDCPAAPICTSFKTGDFKNYNDVYNFGKNVDILTVEIESVNTAALHALEKEGKIVHPKPTSLDIIKDKGLQKKFFKDHNLPSSNYNVYNDASEIKADIENKKISIPFVQKARKDGYDGKGVMIINSTEMVQNLMEVPCVIEEVVNIYKELAVIVARNQQGQVEAYTPVEMVFDPKANLVDYLICPANISEEIIQQSIKLAVDTIEAFDICGLLAVELFLTRDGKLLINEVAPRPHNSGHHTIESCTVSQFQQHLRAITNLPLLKPIPYLPAAMINLLGQEGHIGRAILNHTDETLRVNGLFIHLYGKKVTKPFRKMGHVTVVNQDINKALSLAKEAKKQLTITTHE